MQVHQDIALTGNPSSHPGVCVGLAAEICQHPVNLIGCSGTHFAEIGYTFVTELGSPVEAAIKIGTSKNAGPVQPVHVTRAPLLVTIGVKRC